MPKYRKIREDAVCDHCGYEWLEYHDEAELLQCPTCYELSRSWFSFGDEFKEYWSVYNGK